MAASSKAKPYPRETIKKESALKTKQPSAKAKALKATLAIIELGAARAAFDALADEINAIASNDVAPRRIDMQRAAAVAYTVALRDAHPLRRAEFEALAKIGRYNLATLDRLPRLALAAWYARQSQVQVQFRASAASVPEEAVRNGQLIRTRMLRVVDYWLGSQPAVALRLEFLRTGSGHQDLANDLIAAADYYDLDELRQKLTPETPHYVATDRVEARQIAHAIFVSLGLGEESELERWASLAERAWTLLTRAYDEHRARGLFLFGESEDVESTYPSLVAAVRSAPVRRRSPEEPGEAPVDQPAGEPVDEPDGGDDSIDG